MQNPPMTPGVIFVLVVIGLVSFSFVLLLIYKAAAMIGRKRQHMSSHAPGTYLIGGVRYLEDYTPNEPENEPEPLANLALQSRTGARTGAFVLNPEECAAVAKMIEHKVTAEKPTKASIIWAGFAVKKGDSAKYKRASEIYDALFVLPEPNKYPNMTTAQRKDREELGLSVR